MKRLVSGWAKVFQWNTTLSYMHRKSRITFLLPKRKEKNSSSSTDEEARVWVGRGFLVEHHTVLEPQKKKKNNSSSSAYEQALVWVGNGFLMKHHTLLQTQKKKENISSSSADQVEKKEEEILELVWVTQLCRERRQKKNFSSSSWQAKVFL